MLPPDFDMLVRLCGEYHLHSALLYVYAIGMQQFTPPLRFLLRESEGKGKGEGRGADRNAGYLALLFLHNCLVGRSWPSGVLSPEEAIRARADVLRFLLDEPSELRALIAFDPAECMVVLAAALEPNVGELERERLCLFRALADLLVDRSQDPLAGVRSSGRPGGHEFMFVVARCLVRGTLPIEGDLLQRVIGFLLLASDQNSAPQRQTLLLELLYKYPEQGMRSDQLVAMAEKAAFHKVTRLFHMRNRQFNSAIKLQLREQELSGEVSV
jgi:Golgi CORVET complex core vacuolar protein 8